MRGWGAMLVSAVMLVGGTGALFWLLYEPTAPTQVDHSPQSEKFALQANAIAVLPFASAGGQEESNYFAEGIAETLLAQMSNVRNLVVKARDSSFALRDPEMDATTKARRLNVAFLLDGSVQRVGDNLRIIVRLVDGASGRYLWSETLDGTASDVFDMQDRIAKSVVTQLEPISSVTPGATAQRQLTGDPAAYDYYLRGRYALADGSPDALDRAIAAFDLAIERDETFALAYIGRAKARALREGMLGFFDVPTPNQDPIRNDWFDYVYPVRASEVGPELEKLIGPDIQKAVELAPDLAEVQAADGLLLLRMGRFDEAEAGLNNVVKTNPNDAFSHAILGLLYFEINRYNLSVEHLEAALALDPLSVTIRADLANALMYTSNRERAIAEFESVRAMAPDRVAWMMVRYPLFHAGRFLDLVKLYLGVLAELRDGERAEPQFEDEILLVFEWIYNYLGDMAGSRRAEEVVNDFKGITKVHGRLVLSQQDIAELDPVDVYRLEEFWAGLMRFAWVIDDESFKDAFDRIAEIMAGVPDGVQISAMTHTVAARYALALGECQVAREQFELAGEDLTPLDWPYSNIFMDSLFAHVDAIDFAIALRCVGEEEQARELIDGTLVWLDEMEANGYGVSQIPVVRAKAHALSGEKEQALDLLEQYAALPGPVLTGIKNDPAFESLTDDPRFQAAVKTIIEKNRLIVQEIDRFIEESGFEF
jgi:TolB-like protein/tetratricopeptide (TPR) repeat protein